MKRSDFRFLDRLRVRWAEVDMQHIVFNAHYLMYFDTAVTGYWRALALPYTATMASLQGDLYVKKATLEYHGSARFDDLCEVGMRCGAIGNSSMRFQAALFRGGKLLVGGELVYVFADPTTQTSRPVPAVLRQLLTGFEAGDAVLRRECGAWAELSGPVLELRRQVMAQAPAQGPAQGSAPEQAQEPAPPPQRVLDEADVSALHAVAWNRLGLPLAAGRLLGAVDGAGRIDRMATRTDMRGAGVGRAVLGDLIAVARARGDARVVLDAASDAAGFYARAGFVADGEASGAEGLRHQAMVLTL